MKAPSNGPDVVENAIIDDSITPEKKPTPNAVPITTNPATTVTSLITLNCCLSVNPLQSGNNERKSSQITVEIEFKLETHMLQIEPKYIRFKICSMYFEYENLVVKCLFISA